MFNFTADSDIYLWVSSGDAHKQPVPWTEASWPEGWRQTEIEMEWKRERESKGERTLIERGKQTHRELGGAKYLYKLFNLAWPIVSASIHCDSVCWD